MNSAIPSDYVVYLQESDYNVGVEHDPKMFSQVVSSKDYDLWYEAMKAEMDSMESNRVWDLIELPIGVKFIGCKWVFKIKKDSLDNFEQHRARLVAKGLLKGQESTIWRPFLLYQGKIHFELSWL